MPELPPFQPSVSVFHFTSKVSNAKIAKYKLATERGMVNSPGATPTTKPNMKLLPEPTESGPNKRPRLRLSVREPHPPDDDVIVVGPPRPASTRAASQLGNNKRSFTNAFSNDKSQPSIDLDDDSSELSSCDSAVLEASTDHMAPSAQVSKPLGSEQYGDFYSYYVQDDGEDQEVVKKASAPLKPATKSYTKHTKSAPIRPSLPQQQGQLSNSLPPQAQYRPPPPAIAPTNIDIRFHEPDTIPIMIAKLEALSAALEEFGGVPPIPRSPKAEADDDTAVDHFLAMFGGQPEAKKADSGPTSFSELSQPGTKDLPLVYGIQFIMNALRCWAEQRTTALRMQEIQQAQMEATRRASLAEVGGALPHIQMPDLTPINLFDTTEGRAIQAFRAVVECGCLQINTVIPQKLAKALRHLYMQVDHLINQTPDRGQTQWRCLSYSAQIEANRVRVQRWKDAQEKAQQEMIRQHQLAHQQMMRQMGLPDQFTSTMFYHHGQDEDAIEVRSGSSAHDLVRLPINLDPDPMPAPQPLPAASGAQQRPSAQDSRTSTGDAVSTAFLPRSGQSMKFSFAPSNTAAVKVFGAQAFPPVNAQQKTSRVTTDKEAEKEVIDLEETAKPVTATGFSAINRPHAGAV